MRAVLVNPPESAPECHLPDRLPRVPRKSQPKFLQGQDRIGGIQPLEFAGGPVVVGAGHINPFSFASQYGMVTISLRLSL
jgi:hypothetical protein